MSSLLVVFSMAILQVHNPTGYLAISSSDAISYFVSGTEITLTRTISTGTKFIKQEGNEAVLPGEQFLSAAVSAPNKDLFVMVRANAETARVERWSVAVAAPEPGSPIQFNVTRHQLTTFPFDDLNRVVAMAVMESEDHIVLIDYLEQELKRVDLTTGTVSTILNSSTDPELDSWNTVYYVSHETLGPAYLIYHHGPSNPSKKLGAALLWDVNQDGNPEVIERLSFEEWQTTYADYKFYPWPELRYEPDYQWLFGD